MSPAYAPEFTAPSSPVSSGVEEAPRQKRAKTPKVDVSRLCTAISRSRRTLERFRSERLAAVRHYVGMHYSENGSERKVPVNLLAQYIQIVGRNLIAKNPRCMLTTRVRKMKPAVDAMQAWLNAHWEENYFAEKLRRWVCDALFSVGVMKVGIASPSDAVYDGYSTLAGTPFCEVVDIDDFVFDTTARDFKHVGFVGHRYRVPLEAAKKMTHFSAAARKKMVATAVGQFNSEGGDEKIEAITTGMEGPPDEYEDMTDLWEIYLPRTKQIVTLITSHGAVPDPDTEPASVVEWVGPHCGPYHYLSFLTVPGNAMPKAPVQDLVDLAELVNKLWRKLSNQSERQKEVLPVSGGQLDDGKNLKQAADGEMFSCNSPQEIKPVSYGGPNPINLQFSMHCRDVFNELAGNLRLLGGAAPQSKTATQDKLLNENAGAGVSDMQETVVTAISRVSSALCWFWWYHPQKVMKTTRQAPGVPEVEIERNLYPRTAPQEIEGRETLRREGAYEDLSLRIDPYSLRYRSPQERLQFLWQTVKELLPLMPIIGPQGVTFDAQFFMKKLAEYSDEPDVVDLFTISEPVQQAGSPGAPTMPHENGGEYIRRSIGQDTQASREQELVDEATSAASQAQQ